ncbi:MAG TPA: glutamyl-tRNA reductase [Ferruginibacter sp.]|nr:glutamyl-tRNA reductase [Ferruginibacter sp.]HMP22449.1 glutamyl-tRNA reductase [Ferruginibacter sp.]
MTETRRDITNFFIAGINYKKTDAALRGQFAITPEQYDKLLAMAPAFGIKELFVVSTCNRTEIYGFADTAQVLIQLLCTQTKSDAALFHSIAYIKNGKDAIQHLFDVAAGLDSQILGDYEILGQIKQAAKFSKEKDCIGAYTERMINAVLQCSKEIKTKTELSGGTVSVAFAAIQYIRENVAAIADKNILLLGTGKIGRNTCKNLVDYLQTKRITLVNRTEDKAAGLAAELGLSHAAAGELAGEVKKADIILVATNAPNPVLLQHHVADSGSKLIIDLSIPYNVDIAVQELPGITLVNVDDLSKIKDATLDKRRAEVPKAKKIIAHHISEFLDWHEMRKHAPVLKAVKNKLQALHNCDLYTAYSSRLILQQAVVDNETKIQKVINGMAVKMRTQNQRGCHYIEAINEFMTTASPN